MSVCLCVCERERERERESTGYMKELKSMRQGMHFLINNSLKRKGKKKEKKREILNKKMSRNQCSKIENGSSNNTVGIFDQFFYRIHTYTKQETEKSIKENDFPTRSNSHLTLLLFFFFLFLQEYLVS